MSRLVKFIKLPGKEQRFLLKALVLLCWYRLALLIVPLHRLLRQNHQRPIAPQTANPIAANRLASLTTAAARVIPGATCLSNALAAHHLLANNGYQAKIHFGVAKTDEKIFKAHAWLSIADEIIIGRLPDLASYRELPEPDQALFTSSF